MGPKEQIETRVYVVLVLLCVLPVLVAAQVVRIQFMDGDALRAQGERQVLALEAIPAKRGSIVDRAGRTLVMNTGRYDLALDPTIPGFTGASANRLFDRLSAITGVRASTFRRKMTERTSPRYVQLHRDLNEAQKESIESLEVPGLIFTPRFSRRYHYGATAAHLLGYVDADGRGISGLELQYDAHLWGEPGRRVAKRDRRGVLKASVQDAIVEPRDGGTIVLTIDLIRQTIMEEELARGLEETGANWATAIAMNPHTGEIMALANMPTYDPNRPAAFPESARRNHAVTDRIEPGSTFKLVTAIAAVEQGVVTLSDTVDTGRGHATFGGRSMRDTSPHGRIPFAEVISLSSNVGTAMTASRLKPGVFYQYARNLGFGQPTWVDLPGEVSGTLRRPSTWNKTTQTSMSIGYAIDATPLQILTAYAALANGGLLVKPYVVAERRDVAGRTVWRATADSVRRVFKRETMEQVRPAFELAVEAGTAKRAQVQGLSIAGKTGTAIKATAGGYRSGAYRASFVGYFPADDPEVVMLIVLDEPRSSGYGGAAAAPIFQRIASRWVGTLPEVALKMAPADTIPALETRRVPLLLGHPAAVAERRLLAQGLQPLYERRSAGGFVVSQHPVAEATAHPGAAVTLATAEQKDTDAMPDLTGLTAREAVYVLALHGVEARVEGSGTVVRQIPGVGAPRAREAVLVCQ